TGELFYDIELQVGSSDASQLRLQQEFSGVVLQGAARVGASGWLGAGLTRGTTDVRIRNPPALLQEALTTDATIDISNRLLNGEFDTRDSDLYPRSGQYAQAEALGAREDLGSDSNYESLELEWNGYRRFGADHVLAWRFAGKIVDGDPPFFALAW